ncbi:MAG TPA: CO dehydrogenase/CO-methylating acetyl-CoA synthase complex subunit beta [Planctomycetes bacterium]|nr:CO dehydrogenase/CO-methylating acetyl-CoA synthase complex subunit beta [Planctomycetota bacterium]
MSAVIRGARGWYDEADKKLAAAAKDKGENAPVEFPNTAFFLPMAYALLGMEAKTLKDCRAILDEVKAFLPKEPSDKLWLPYLGDALDGGVAALLSQEVITAVKYLYQEPVEEGFTGFISDTILRELGIQLVDGRMPGFAAILGPAPDADTAVDVVRQLQQRSILTFIIANRDGLSMRDQLAEKKVEMGWETYIVPVGRDTLSGIYVLNWAIRGALMFGGHKKGDFEKCLRYCRERIFAFGMTFGPIPDDWFALGAGAIDMGFPVISDDKSTDEVHPTGVTTYEALVVETDRKKIVPRAIEVRGVKVKVEEIDIPVPYSPAFEGERVRREDMQVEFGGKYSTAFEYLRTRDLDEIEDGKVTLVGKDVDTAKVGGAMPLAIVIDVAGRKMKKDFESIMERQMHTFLNEAMGIFHMGQRNTIWVRISKGSFEKGFRLKHFGTILHAQMHSVYGKILDKVAVTIYTEEAKVKELLPEAMKAYAERDARVAGMTDESVDTFYTCTLCQSYAPAHVCIISPERLGLCGAYNWLDGQAAYEMNPTGCNQPVEKGGLIDQPKGQWEGINAAVQKFSNAAVQKMNLYSIMEDPMTSCGCFECILAIVPEANGFMIVNREFGGMTPCGMAFSTLAGSVGGGNQTPGFLGVGRLYVTSKKFILAEGGLKRLVWMPKELKEFLSESLKQRSAELGIPDMLDKIGDETVAETGEQLLEFMQKAGHPALEMPPLM